MQFLPSINFLFFVLYLALCPQWAEAKSLIVLNKARFGKLNISQDVEIWVSPQSSWKNIFTEKHADFRPVNAQDLERMDRGVTWFRFTFRNDTSDALPLMLLTESLFYPAAFYQKLDGKISYLSGFNEQLGGLPADRNLGTAAANFTLAPGETREIYFKAHKNPTTTSLPFTLCDEVEAHTADRHSLFLKGLIIGIGVVVFIYNTFVAIRLQQWPFASYALYVLCFHNLFFFSAPVYPILTDQLWIRQHGELILALSTEVLLISASLFTVSFLDLRRREKWLATLILGAIPLYVINFFLAFQDPKLNETIANIELLAFGLAVIFAGLRSVLQGYHPARYFLVGWGVLIGANTLYTLAEFGLIPLSPVLEWAVYGGGSFEILTLTLGLSYRIQLEQREAREQIAALNHSLQVSHEALEASYSELQHRENARTQLFHHVSHELRTPLNGILGYLNLALRGQAGQLSYELRDVLHKTFTLADTLKVQIYTILELAQAKRGKLKVQVHLVDLSQLGTKIQNLADGLCLMQKHASFHLLIEGDAKLKAFRSDYEKIYAILRNLVGNAIKFSSQDRPNRVQVVLRVLSNTLEIDVFDTGIGIRQERIETIFDEFEKAQEEGSRRFEGAGLGLALVRTYTKTLGGQIQVYSDFGVGTHFLVRIPESSEQPMVLALPEEDGMLPPLMSRSSAAKTGGELQGETQVLSGSRIWVVDDQPDNCEVLASLLRYQGAQVYAMTDGRQALEKIPVDRPDLILLDMMMPEFSGEDCLAVIKSDQNFKDIPVIMLTARAGEFERMRIIGLGADDYLCKPIVEQELLLRVKNLLDRVQMARAEGAYEEQVRLSLLDEFLTGYQAYLLQSASGQTKGDSQPFALALKYLAPTGGQWQSLGDKTLHFRRERIGSDSEAFSFDLPVQKQQVYLQDMRGYLGGLDLPLPLKRELWRELLVWRSERQQALAYLFQLEATQQTLHEVVPELARTLGLFRVLCSLPSEAAFCDGETVLLQTIGLLQMPGFPVELPTILEVSPLVWPGSAHDTIPLVLCLTKTLLELAPQSLRSARLFLACGSEETNAFIRVKLICSNWDVKAVERILWSQGLAYAQGPMLMSFLQAKQLARRSGVELKFLTQEDGLNFFLRIARSSAQDVNLSLAS